jgi:hypothetical protein
MNRVVVAAAFCSVLLSSTGYSQNTPRRNPKPKATPCPGVHSIAECPEEGCGGRIDAELNHHKNVPADDRQPVLQSIQWMKDLPEPDPKLFTVKNPDRGLLKGEGEKITVVAWALAARSETKTGESCNCKLTTVADTDNHIVLIDPAIEEPTLAENEKRDSETAEFTPRVRGDHPNFTQEKLEPLIDPSWRAPHSPKEGKLLVRVTGLLMFDSEHFLRNHLKRHNNWEIHPILKMEYCPQDQACDENSDANWKDLDLD